MCKRYSEYEGGGWVGKRRRKRDDLALPSHSSTALQLASCMGEWGGVKERESVCVCVGECV